MQNTISSISLAAINKNDIKYQQDKQPDIWHFLNHRTAKTLIDTIVSNPKYIDRIPTDDGVSEQFINYRIFH